ncbi:hypothetical protein PIE10_RS10065 [Escherichia coli]
MRYLPESFEIPWNPNTRTEVSTLCISQFRYSAQIRPSSVVTKDYTLNDPAGQGVLIRKASTRITSARSMKCMTTPDVSRVPTGRTLPAGRWTAGETMQKPRGE